uniref:Uncharacterized protein n=1 Tax=viral metagenome TaxID=1070528 RepID=A0A6C0AN28_9ZZZZ
MTYNELVEKCKDKTLIYFCIFHNKGYIELLQLLVSSLILRSNLENIDLLVITSSNFTKDIEHVSKKLNIHIDIYTLDFSELHEALCSRIYIFDYPLVTLYKHILYLDTDIIIQGDINSLVNCELEEKLYAFREGTIGHPYWGGEFFDFSKFNKEQSGFNSGILLFKPVKSIKDNFSKVKEHIDIIISKKSKLPDCPDQSLLNYYFIKENLYNISLMDTSVTLYSRYADIKSINEKNIICHFTWPIGNTGNKKNRMMQYYSNFLNYLEKGSFSPLLNLVGLRYSWGTSGYIQLEKDSLITTWSRGSYKWIDSHLAILAWNRFRHILRFNSSYTNFLSLRISDLDTITGNLDFIKDKRIVNSNIVIILTMTVNVGKKDTLFQVNPRDRIDTYLKSIRAWLTKTELKIVVVENSGYLFKELSEELERYKGRFEFVLYDENTLDESEHLKNNTDKGISELFSINYAKKHSILIKNSLFIIKITGRYFIEELDSYLSNYNLGIYDVLCQNNIKFFPRCEMIGCHMKHFDTVFSLNLNNEVFKIVEIHYRDRILKFNTILECKRFTIEPRQGGGRNILFTDI